MKEAEATVVRIDHSDVITTAKRIETLHDRLEVAEFAAEKARKELESAQNSARKHLERFPVLLAEFDAELAELARRRAERAAREARITALRKQAQR